MSETLRRSLLSMGLLPNPELERELKSAVAQGELPTFKRQGRSDVWQSEDLPFVGKRAGWLKAPSHSVVLATFVTKGGVLKSSITLNLARTAARNGLRTLVIGLDLQGDLTTCLSADREDATAEDLDSALAQSDSERGLYDYFLGEVGLTDVIRSSDLAGLDYIPETPELIALDMQLLSRPRREYWLGEKVLTPLRQRYDLILLDCSPNWNQLTTNALVACDLLLSPLECKINNFRNLKLFQKLIRQCRSDLQLKFTHLFVPTRHAPGRKLSSEILNWYRENIPGCLPVALRESVAGEEATALRLSLFEHAPNSPAAQDWRDFLKLLWPHLISAGVRSRSNNLERNLETPWPSH